MDSPDGDRHERLVLLNYILETAAMKSVSTPTASKERRDLEIAEDKENLRGSADLSAQAGTSAKKCDSYEEIAKLESFMKEVEGHQGNEKTNIFPADVSAAYGATISIQEGSSKSATTHSVRMEAQEGDDSDCIVTVANYAAYGMAKDRPSESNSDPSGEVQSKNADSQMENVVSIHTLERDLRPDSSSTTRPQPATRIRTTPAKESRVTDKLAQDRKARFKALAANIDDFEVDYKPRSTCKRPAPKTMALGISSPVRNRMRPDFSSGTATEALPPAKANVVTEDRAKVRSQDTIPSMQSPAVPMAEAILKAPSLAAEDDGNPTHEERVCQTKSVTPDIVPPALSSSTPMTGPPLSEGLTLTFKSRSLVAEFDESAVRKNETIAASSTAPFQSSPVAECGIESFFRRKSPSMAKAESDSSIAIVPSCGSRVHFSKEVAVIDAYEALDISTDRKSGNYLGKDKLVEDTGGKVEMDSFAAIKPGHVASLAKQFESNLPPRPSTKETAHVVGARKFPIAAKPSTNEAPGRRSPKRSIEDSEQPFCSGNVKKLCAKWQAAEQADQPVMVDIPKVNFEKNDNIRTNTPKAADQAPSEVSQMATSKQSTDPLSEEDLVNELECQYIDDQPILGDETDTEYESQTKSTSAVCREILADVDVGEGSDLGSSTDLDVKELDEDSENDSCFLYQEKSSIDFSYTTSEVLSGGEATPALSSKSATKDTSSRLRSVSSYRCHVKEHLAGTTPNKLVYKFPEQSESSKKPCATAGRNSEQRFIQKLQELKGAERIQLEHIHQASRAINLCLSVFNFRGSPEEIDAQKALLLATEKRRCITAEIDRITRCIRERRNFEPTEPLGTLTISHISIPLRMEYIRRVLLTGDVALIYYFICVLKHNDAVYSTHMTSTENASNGFLEFSNYFQIDCLPPDFELKFELYCLTSEKRDGYHLPMEKKNTFTLNLRKAKTARLPSRGGLPAISDASFKLVGDARITLATVRRSRFNLENLNMLIPVEGLFMMRSRCCPHSVLALKPEKGFLNVCNPAGVWQLYWCILKEGILEFWRFPEDVTKEPLKTIDLHFCTMLKPASEEITSRPNTMVLDMSITDTNDQEPVSQLLSADSEKEYERWRESIERVLSFTKVWGAELPCGAPSITSV